ncbi:hypothetical protein ACI3ET_05035 [Ornithinimicrobium sp. LYQ121]|uniref:hypothetical protein n=1 Tax=Ornithinimicrobium sp. LYQ121 TaxID=3378801 RepID=UPI003852B86C
MSPHDGARAAEDWLTLRRAADSQARDRGASGLLELLMQHLEAHGAHAVVVVDVGAGTGANRVYLQARLPWPQRWVVVDVDPRHLEHPDHGDATRVEAEVATVGHLLADLAARETDPVVLTCAALLDVLPTAELEALAGAVLRHRVPALLSLTVTGHVELEPADPDDDLVRRLFDDHQRRRACAGPEAAAVLTALLEAGGARVRSAPTPWVLDADRSHLLRRWLDERLAAAVEQAIASPDPADHLRALTAWHRRRRVQLDSGGLAARVHHVDLLVLPH